MYDSYLLDNGSLRTTGYRCKLGGYNICLSTLYFGLFDADFFQLISSSNPNSFDTSMWDQGIFHLLSSCDIITFIDENTDVALSSCSHPIGRTFSTLGVTEVHTLNFDSSRLLDCLTSKDGVVGMITSSVVLVEEARRNFWMLVFEGLDNMLN